MQLHKGRSQRKTQEMWEFREFSPHNPVHAIYWHSAILYFSTFFALSRITDWGEVLYKISIFVGKVAVKAAPPSIMLYQGNRTSIQSPFISHFAVLTQFHKKSYFWKFESNPGKSYLFDQESKKAKWSPKIVTFWQKFISLVNFTKSTLHKCLLVLEHRYCTFGFGVRKKHLWWYIIAQEDGEQKNIRDSLVSQRFTSWTLNVWMQFCNQEVRY